MFLGTDNRMWPFEFCWCFGSADLRFPLGIFLGFKPSQSQGPAQLSVCGSLRVNEPSLACDWEDGWYVTDLVFTMFLSLTPIRGYKKIGMEAPLESAQLHTLCLSDRVLT